MSCDPDKDCWCAELTNILPLPDTGARGCLCRACLTKTLESSNLNLWKKRLGRVPEWMPSLGRLTKLRYLNIGENAFRALPESIFSMTSLIELRASDNRLASLPDSLGRLARLRELHLRNNRLTSLPESIGTLQDLRQIDLRGNPLTHLPAAIAALPRLEKLDLRWVNIPPPAWTANLEARGCAVYR